MGKEVHISHFIGPSAWPILLSELGACPCVATGIQLSIRQHTKHTIKNSQLKESHPKNDLKLSAQFDMLIW
jgi:hypothetical protein